MAKSDGDSDYTTTAPESSNDDVTSVLFVICAVLVICGLVLHLLSIVVFLQEPMRKKCFRYMLAISVTDFIQLCMAIPSYYVCRPCSAHSKPICRFLIGPLSSFSEAANFYCVFFFALDVFVAVRLPEKYKNYQSDRLYALRLLTTLGLSLTAVFAFVVTDRVIGYKFRAIFEGIFHLVPLCLIILMFVSVILCLKKRENHDSNHQKDRQSQNYRNAKLLCCMIIALMVEDIPDIIGGMISRGFCGNARYPTELKESIDILQICGNLSNFFLYCYCNTEFRQTLVNLKRHLLTCSRNNNVTQDENQTTTTA